MELRQKDTTNYPILFLMVDNTDHITGKTGLTPTIIISKNGSAFGPAAGVVTELSNGWYSFAGNATDRDTLGSLAIHASASGADPCDLLVLITSYDSLVDVGSILSKTNALPNDPSSESLIEAAISASEALIKADISTSKDSIEEAVSASESVIEAAILAIPPLGDIYVAVSSVVARSVSTGSLSIETHHTFREAITSNTSLDLTSATKLWFAVKRELSFEDENSVIFIEKTEGLIIVDKEEYPNEEEGREAEDGSIIISGSSGDWLISLFLDEKVTALLMDYDPYTICLAEVKAIIDGEAYNIWSGSCDINKGLIKSY